MAGTCDQWAGLYERTDGGEGCYRLVQVSVANDWQEAGLWLAVVVVALLAALLVAQLRKGA